MDAARLWFNRSKGAFAWLAAHDAPVHARFERALCDGASDEVLAELVELVYVAAG